MGAGVAFRGPDQRGSRWSSKGIRKEALEEVMAAPSVRAAWEFPRQEWGEPVASRQRTADVRHGDKNRLRGGEPQVTHSTR